MRTLDDPAKIDLVFPHEAKLRVLNVWATWCMPCVLEMRDLRAIDDTFGPEVALAGVSLDDLIPGATEERVVNLLEKYRITFPNIYYTGNADALGERLAFNGGIPITIVYAADGREVWRNQGRIDRAAMIERLRTLLKTNEETP